MRLAPKNGASAPGMGAADSTGQSGVALFGKSKRALLALFCVQPKRSFCLRQITLTLGIDTPQSSMPRNTRTAACFGVKASRSSACALVRSACLC